MSVETATKRTYNATKTHLQRERRRGRNGPWRLS